VIVSAHERGADPADLGMAIGATVTTGKSTGDRRTVLSFVVPIRLRGFSGTINAEINVLIG
jgi:hypothetical protein